MAADLAGKSAAGSAAEGLEISGEEGRASSKANLGSAQGVYKSY